MGDHDFDPFHAGRPYDDLGPDYLDRRADPEREARRLIARLEAPGKHVTLHDTA